MFLQIPILFDSIKLFHPFLIPARSGMINIKCDITRRIQFIEYNKFILIIMEGELNGKRGKWHRNLNNTILHKVVRQWKD